MLAILELQRSIAEVLIVRKDISRSIRAVRRQPLNIPRSTCDNVRGGLGIVVACRVHLALVHGREALRVVYVAEDGEIHARLVEDGFECVLAWAALLVAKSVPRPVSGYDEPRRLGSIDAGQVRAKEGRLLAWEAEAARVEVSGAVSSVGCIFEVGLGIKHHNVRHAVLEGEPEWWVCQGCSLLGVRLEGFASGLGWEGGGHGSAESVLKIGEVLLPGGTESGSVGDFLAIGFVVAGRCHVR